MTVIHFNYQKNQKKKKRNREEERSAAREAVHEDKNSPENVETEKINQLWKHTKPRKKIPVCQDANNGERLSLSKAQLPQKIDIGA